MKKSHNHYGPFPLFLCCNLILFLTPVIQERDALEAYLRTARIVRVERETQVGRTEPWMVHLDDGRIARRARFKYVDRQRPALFPDSYRYELAAYRLDRLLGFELVPPMVEREVDGVRGALQIFLDDVIPEAERVRRQMEPTDSAKFRREMELVRIFEALTYTSSGHGTDTLVRVSTSRVWRVDFSESFAPVPELLPNHNFRRCSQKVYQRMQALNRLDLDRALGAYLNESELQALWSRVQRVRDRLRDLIAEQGADRVLFLRTELPP